MNEYICTDCGNSFVDARGLQGHNCEGTGYTPLVHCGGTGDLSDYVDLGINND